mgnify:CR=1 FL=1
MNKTILITGAAGFLGSHLCEYYVNKGFKVFGLDNLLTGDINNLNSLKSETNFEFINHDITNNIRVKDDINYILNFASPASPIDHLKIPIKTLEVGSKGSQNCLELALDKGATILVASTSEVYGDPLIHPQKEDYWGNVNPIGKRSAYDEGKRYMEAMTIAYNQKFKLKTRIVRIFNTYGPRMRINDGRALSTFFSQALTNRDLTVFGDGNQTRSFCYVDDLILGIDKLLKSDYNLPINLGNPDEISLKDFANEIINLTNSSSKIKFFNLPEDDPKRRKPDITLANKILGWRPKTSRPVGLKKTYEYFLTLSIEQLMQTFKTF